MLRRLLALPLALALIGATPAPAPSAPKPALWKLSDADTTLWLFGTIHALPPGYRWTTPAIDAAVAGSSELILETVLDTDPDKGAALLLGLGMSPGLPPLAERVDAPERTTLTRAVAASRVPPAMLDGMETWAAAIVLMQGAVSGLKLQPGADAALRARFAGKPVSGLETPAQQLGFLDALPEAEQRRLLASVLADTAAIGDDFAAMLAAWARGDEAAIARTFDDEAKVSPMLREALLTRRNRAWTAWLEARLRQPGTAFVAIGAGHLAGRDSLPALLAGKGFKVERVD